MAVVAAPEPVETSPSNKTALSIKRNSGLTVVGPLAFLVLECLQLTPAHAAPSRACGGEIADTVFSQAAVQGALALKGAAQVDVEAPLSIIPALAGPNFLLVPSAAGLAESACAPAPLAEPLLTRLVEEVNQSAHLDPQITVVLTLQELSCPRIYYVPVANDVRGIGYQHKDPREVFDDSPDSSLEGVAFLNDWPYWQRRPQEFVSAFHHEIGHRWGARVWAVIDGEPSSEILGRELAHWSYFVHTNGSPLEGNTWTTLEADHYRTATPESAEEFSALDLYLMGLVEPATVEDSLLLLEPTSTDVDCFGSPLQRHSPPQWCAPADVVAQSGTVGIQAVLDAEGERVPATAVGRVTVDVTVVVLQASQGALTASVCEELELALEERVTGFAAATGGRMTLRNLVSGMSCQALLDAEAATPGTSVAGAVSPQGCAFAAARRSGPQTLLWLVVLALFRLGAPRPSRAAAK